ncbi:hypothetical protein FSP39_006090 [Pinctada imbricata]|uniref:Hexosyltransferase n=1 Tax=Pinctada imbricata TaxID=66713 RepID=A0AA88XSN9_PINIB|nr:hypothetical protein FSP39_006090 [Pinctada imbricata]
MKHFRGLFGRNPNHDYYILRHCEEKSDNDTDDAVGTGTPFMPMRFHWKLLLLTVFALTTIFGLYLSTKPSTIARSHHVSSVYMETQQTTQNFIHQEIHSNCQGSDCMPVIAKTKDDEYAAYFVPAKEKINPFYHTFLKDGRTICREAAHPFLLILVPTSPSHSKERNAIRSTWASVAKHNQWPFNRVPVRVKVVFILGRSHNDTLYSGVEHENRIFNDIIQGDFLDSYNNLALKILLGLRWTSLYCSDVSYILKADDDMFVNIPVLIDVINEYDKRLSHNGLILGNINSDAKVRRVGRWAVSKDAYPFPHFPPYAYGNSYVISANIVSRLFSRSEYMPYVPVEDAYITGILAKSVEAEHYNIPGFAYWLEHKPSPCDFVKNKKISATKVSPDYMYYIWDKMHTLDVTC